MSCRDHVHTRVRNRPSEREHEKRRAVAERHGRQAAGSEYCPAADEQSPAVTRGMALVAPAPDNERHRETRGRVHHHHKPDQRGSFPDLREKQWEVGRQHRPDKAGTDCCGGEDEQVGETPPRSERDGEDARQPSRYQRINSDATPRASQTRGRRSLSSARPSTARQGSPQDPARHTQ
jgi:hypothetical protein